MFNGCVRAACCLLLGLLCAVTALPQPVSGVTTLRDGWKLQSACVALASGEVISSESFDPTGWIDTTVPHTVLGAQVDAKIFPHPFFGKNLRAIPGTDYPEGKIFAYLPMSESSPYHCSWWYRKTFTGPTATGRILRLHFDGINYRANLWLNGRQIADAQQVAGAFRAYDFNVTQDIRQGGTNVLAVQVFAQTENDLGIDFLDWNPGPADKSLGLWRDVSLMESGPASLGKPFVITHFQDDVLSAAELTVAGDVVNRTVAPLSVEVTGQIGTIIFSQRVELKAKEQKEVRFDVSQFPQLRVQHPSVWWPYQYGQPNLEDLRLTLTSNGAVSDQKSVRFGIREVEETLDVNGHALFKVNRHNILVRGGGWTPDMFYRESYARILQELRYVKAMNLNTIRLEGTLGTDDLFDLADKLGILVMAGWQCCDHWQHWDHWTDADHAIAHESMYSQITRLRSHPSVMVWLNGSDEVPAPEVEKDFLAVLAEREWPAGVLSTAAARKSAVSGPSGVKMSGPYDYVPPEYWYLDKTKAGGAFGFNTETSPGPAIPLLSSIRRTLPRESWWPMDDQWKFHAGSGRFAQYDLLNHAMQDTYGEQTSAESYNLRAQWMAYDGERAMFEAYGANKYASTGVIQWMLNNGWPSFIWHLYDFYLVPGGGYFGTKKANEPLHVQYRYDDARIAVVNSTLRAYEGLEVRAHQVAIDGSTLFAKRVRINVGPDGLVSALAIPPQVATTLLSLKLLNGKGRLLSENFYVVPAKTADLDWAKTTNDYTPANSYANMQDLSRLRSARVVPSLVEGPQLGHFRVRLFNASKVVAFCLQIRATEKGADSDVAPAYWSDNYISVLPGEAVNLTLDLEPDQRPHLAFTLQGWNVASHSFALAAPRPRATPVSSIQRVGKHYR